MMRGKRYYTTQLMDLPKYETCAPESIGHYALIGVQSLPPMYYDVLDMTNNQYLGWNDLSKFCEDIGVSTVPLISYGYRFDLTPEGVESVAQNMNETLGKVVAGMVYRTVEPEWVLEHRLELVIRNARY
jgi:hypothetical protein